MLIVLGLCCIKAPEIDYRIFAERFKLESSTSQSVVFQRVLKHAVRANAQLKENLEALAFAETGINKALVYEQLRQVPAIDAANALSKLTAEGSDNKNAEGEAQGPGRRAWLTIGILSTIHQAGTDFLAKAVGSILDELPMDTADPFYGKVRVLVLNTAGSDNREFQELQIQLLGRYATGAQSDKARVYLEMRDSAVAPVGSNAIDPDPGSRSPSLPPPSERVDSSLGPHLAQLASLSEPSSEYFMLMDGTFEMCPLALHHLLYALQKLNTQRKPEDSWLALRVSYGMNGLLLRRPDQKAFAAFLAQRGATLPVGDIWREFAMHESDEAAALAKKRELYIYRFNLLVRLGRAPSNAVDSASMQEPSCYELMTHVWGLERPFSNECLATSDFTPCTSPSNDVLPGDLMRLGRPE